MAEPPDSTAPAPRIKITRLHIEGYRSLRRVRWPEDGLGWDGAVPDTVLVGGLNGSGKTTLLELIFDVVQFMLGGPRWSDPSSEDVRAFIRAKNGCRLEVGMILGDERHRLGVNAVGVQPHRDAENTWLLADAPGLGLGGLIQKLTEARVRLATRFDAVDAPRLIYFPTDRAVPIPHADFKRAGVSERPPERDYRYSAPTDWNHSVEAILYDARWRDLNAKEHGKPSPGHFAAFERVMQRFFAGEKHLYWDEEGVLHVKMKDGALHPLAALSSGEKQVLLFAAELVRRWTPGSLVLIDEPELHLHEAWLAALWMLIGELQRERGGQVIVTTQSNYLWGLAEPGTQVLLGGRRLA